VILLKISHKAAKGFNEKNFSQRRKDAKEEKKKRRKGEKEKGRKYYSPHLQIFTADYTVIKK